MNLLLLGRDELDESQSCLLQGRRAEHVLRVLGAAPGDVLRAGIRDETLGLAHVTAVEDQAVHLTFTAETEVPLPEKVLCLAVPRPKVLSRCIQHATALGFARISLFRSYRVEKSHLSSPRLSPERLQQDVFLGMEQGRRVHTPIVELFERFRPFVEDHLDALATERHRYVGHPHAATSRWEARSASEPYTLVIGPEGGFIDYEIGAFEGCGFVPMRAGNAPLRVESAISYLAGQLDLIHQVD